MRMTMRTLIFTVMMSLKKYQLPWPPWRRWHWWWAQAWAGAAVGESHLQTFYAVWMWIKMMVNQPQVRPPLLCWGVRWPYGGECLPRGRLPPEDWRRQDAAARQQQVYKVLMNLWRMELHGATDGAMSFYFVCWQTKINYLPVNRIVSVNPVSEQVLAQARWGDAETNSQSFDQKIRKCLCSDSPMLRSPILFWNLSLSDEVTCTPVIMKTSNCKGLGSTSPSTMVWPMCFPSSSMQACPGPQRR